MKQYKEDKVKYRKKNKSHKQMINLKYPQADVLDSLC